MPPKNILQQHWKTFNHILPVTNNMNKELYCIDHNKELLKNNNTSFKHTIQSFIYMDTK